MMSSKTQSKHKRQVNKLKKKNNDNNHKSEIEIFPTRNTLSKPVSHVRRQA